MENIKKNPMATTDVKKLMLILGIPMIFSMIVQALYNIVDTMFVAMIEVDGIENYGTIIGTSALGKCFPIQMLMIAIGVGLGVGVNSMLSKSLGEGDREKASKYCGNSVVILAIVCILFMLFGIFGAKPFISLMYSEGTAYRDELIEAGTTYLRVCTILSFGVFGYMIYEKFLQGTGKSVECMIGQVLGAVINIGLDALFILVFKMGVFGAALATVIGQVVSFVLDLIFHFVLNKEIDNNLKYFKLDKTIIKNIFKIGFPAVIMQALMSIMSLGANIILERVLGDSFATAYADYYKVQQFIFFAVFGLNNAIIPIVAFNLGMGDKERVKQGILWGVLYSVIVMAVGIILFEAIANPIANMLSSDSEITENLVNCMRIIPIGFIFVGINVAYQGIFQSLGSGLKSLIISTLRLIIPCLPLLFLFANVNNMVVWLAFPISEFIATIVCIFFAISSNKKVVEKIGQNI